MGNAETVEMLPWIDVHVHDRGFAQEYKETPETASRAAVAGGVLVYAAMPNFEPDMEFRPYTLGRMWVVQSGRDGQYCDIATWAAAQPWHDNIGQLDRLLRYAPGVKFYIGETQGNNQALEPRDFRDATLEIHRTHPEKVIAAHVVDESIEESIALFAGEIGQRLHIPHVNTMFMLNKIWEAKLDGLPVTAGLTPHHAFLSAEDVARLGWRGEMKPPLVFDTERQELLANIEKFDVIEGDHAPHSNEDKNRADELNPEHNLGTDDVKCYGVPTLDAMLPMFITEARRDDSPLTPELLERLTHHNPLKLLGIPPPEDSHVVVSMEEYEFSREDVRSKAGWSPFIGQTVMGRVVEAQLRGQQIYRFERGIHGKRHEMWGPRVGRVLLPVEEAA